jgi:hypothetical protein
MGRFTRLTRLGGAHILFSLLGDNARRMASAKIWAFKINKFVSGVGSVVHEHVNSTSPTRRGTFRDIGDNHESSRSAGNSAETGYAPAASGWIMSRIA